MILINPINQENYRYEVEKGNLHIQFTENKCLVISYYNVVVAIMSHTDVSHYAYFHHLKWYNNYALPEDVDGVELIKIKPETYEVLSYSDPEVIDIVIGCYFEHLKIKKIQV